MTGFDLLIGVDIGGTFTDLMLFNPAKSSMKFMKVLTASDDLSKGVMEGIRLITEAEKVSISNISSVIHGSTIGINTVIERKGAKTGLITTSGFEDVLLIGRQTRPRVYDWRVGRPSPLVQGYLRKGVKGRVDYLGEVLEPLDVKAVKDAVIQFKEHDVESVAICLLHSYANPSHEIKVKEILHKEEPSLFVSVSSELLPEFREFERMSTTVVNSYIGPVVSRYLVDMENALNNKGVQQLLIMEANGGLMAARDAIKRAVGTIESGPAGGVLAAAYIGELVGRKNLISFDMGGTTAKSSIIIDSLPLITTMYEISLLEQGERLVKGSGYPIKTPVIDLVEVGAGGGSIAWIDPGGALRVGPQSAGADPGPACYGKGCTEPTITDANVVLGRIDPDYFLGGKMSLDAKASKRVVERLADGLGVSLLDAAEGIISVVNSIMARGVRYVTTERGYDVKGFSLVAFGGAAPVQILDLAGAVGVEEVIIPPSPGVFSAFGFLIADLTHHYVKTSYTSCSETSWSVVDGVFQELEELGNKQLDKDNVPLDNRRMMRSFDMRYIGQSHELNVPVSSEDLNKVITSFHRVHEKQYGYFMPDEEVAIVSYRLVAMGVRPKPLIQKRTYRAYASTEALKGSRRVHFGDGGWVNCSVYDRDLLQPSHTLSGPCVVEEWDTTTVVNAGYEGRVDPYGNLILTPGGG